MTAPMTVPTSAASGTPAADAPVPAEAFARAYHALTLLVAANPQLMAFAGWPVATAAPRPPRKVPAADILRAWAGGHIEVTVSLHEAVRDLTDFVDWQTTYDAADVGEDFLNRYGWFELVGPTGHFHAEEVRAYIAYWDSHLDYPWHVHEAEELYYVISGNALFEAEGVPPVILGPGDMRFHGTMQPHAMKTGDSPVLCLVLWRGAGIAGEARIGVV